jgi:hypothetical protein
MTDDGVIDWIHDDEVNHEKGSIESGSTGGYYSTSWSTYCYYSTGNLTLNS